MTETPERITLTEAQLIDLDEYATTDPKPDYAAMMVKTWQTIIGADRWHATESLNPRMYAIPDAQWQRLCQMFIDLGRDKHGDLSGVNHGLDFMNVGPSSFDD